MVFRRNRKMWPYYRGDRGITEVNVRWGSTVLDFKIISTCPGFRPHKHLKKMTTFKVIVYIKSITVQTLNFLPKQKYASRVLFILCQRAQLGIVYKLVSRLMQGPIFLTKYLYSEFNWPQTTNIYQFWKLDDQIKGNKQVQSLHLCADAVLLLNTVCNGEWVKCQHRHRLLTKN